MTLAMTPLIMFAFGRIKIQVSIFYLKLSKFLVFSCQVMHCPTTNFHSWRAPKPTLMTWPPWFWY